MKEKSIKTCMERYGVPNGGGSEYALKKIRDKMMENYGYSTYFAYMHHTPRVKRAVLDGNVAKYGDEFPQRTEAIKKKIVQYSIKKYGCSNINTFRSYRLMLADPDSEPCFSLAELDASEDKILKFRCKRCGNEFMSLHKNGVHSKCDKCFPHGYGNSIEESELYDFISNLIPGSKVVRHDRTVLKPMELDIYIPSKRIAIEFDGLYWHSHEALGDANYHVKKTDRCNELGIRLIHVFENEWVTKRELVESRIRDVLGVRENTVFARKCEIREIGSALANQFVESYHMQGAANGSVRFGLFHGNELLSVMTFSKPRFTKNAEWELLRYCVKPGYHIPGGASKLLKHFERKYSPRSLVSYADRRWSNGGLYESLGFSLKGKSRPNYWYHKPSREFLLESRVKYQKHRLPSLLEKFDETLSERENMRNNGFFSIYDCGNLVFRKEYGKI